MALSNKMVTTDMTVFCWGPVLSVYSSIGLERQSTFQSVLYYSWKTKNFLDDSVSAVHHYASSWHGSQSASILITLLSSMWRTMTTRNFDQPKWRVATVAMVVNDLHEINVGAATGLYTN